MKKYFIEKINASDSEYKITFLNNEREKIFQGDLIFEYESSKTSFACISEFDGYVYFNKNILVGNLYPVNTTIAFVSSQKMNFKDLSNISKNQ